LSSVKRNIFAGTYEKQKNQTTSHSSKHNFAAFASYALVGIGIVILLLLVVFVVYFGLDALHPITESMLPNKDYFLLKVALRYFVFLMAATEVFRTAITFLPAAIVMLLTLNNSSSRMAQVARHAKRFSWRGFSCSPSALKTIKIYKMIQVYLTVMKPLYTYLVPILIFCGSLLAVVCNFATIAMYDKLELPLYICTPIASIMVIVMIVTLVPQAQNVFENCRAYQKELRFTVRSKVEKAVLRSLRPFGINCQFFMMKSCIRPKIIEYQLYYTMTLLISIKVPEN